MTGIMVTGVTALCFGVLMGLLAFLFLSGKCAELVAGYNDMTEEQKNASAESTAKTNGKTLMISAVLTLIYSAVSIVTAFEILPKAVFVIATVVYCIIKAEQHQTSDEFMKSLKKRIDEYAEKYYKIDRNELFKLVNNIRYGKTNSSV